MVIDADQTLLKEVSTEKKNYPLVQALRYTPSSDTMARYLRRVRTGKGTPTTLHFEIEASGKEITSYVVPNPLMGKLLSTLRDLGKVRETKIFLMSLNDEERSKAVIEQLRYDGMTLSEWGVDLAKETTFKHPDRKMNKDLTLFRSSLPAGLENYPILVIDDKPGFYRRQTPLDHIVKIPAWNEKKVAAHLEGLSIAGSEDSEFLVECALLLTL